MTSRAAALLLTLTAIAQCWAPASVGAEPDKKVSPADAASAGREREALRKRLDGLRKDIAQREEEHTDAADALKESEQAISRTNRRLAELDGMQKQANTDLSRQSDAITRQESAIAARQESMAKLLKGQYTSGGLTPWGALLSGDDPQRLNRNLAYLGYVSQARAEAVKDLRGELDNLTQLRGHAESKRTELQQIAGETDQQRQQLLTQSQQRRQVLDSISSKLDTQRKEAANVARDEKRLTSVIDNLTRVLAQQAAEARARRAEAARKADEARRAAAAEQAKPPTASANGRPAPDRTPPDRTSPPKDATVARNDTLPDASLSGQFAKLRGRLRLPVRGDVVGRFGTPRGEGGTWRGVFIRSPEGTEVHAVAAGKVVFADWLRGFGNLLIIDHGSEYLSIYGNNQSVLRHVGDDVNGGDVVAAVGATGGQAESGLYFELRHGGAPFDPLQWTH